jgi:hypothetical protein
MSADDLWQEVESLFTNHFGRANEKTRGQVRPVGSGVARTALHLWDSGLLARAGLVLLSASASGFALQPAAGLGSLHIGRLESLYSLAEGLVAGSVIGIAATLRRDTERSSWMRNKPLVSRIRMTRALRAWCFLLVPLLVLNIFTMQFVLAVFDPINAIGQGLAALALASLAMAGRRANRGMSRVCWNLTRVGVLMVGVGDLGWALFGARGTYAVTISLLAATGASMYSVGLHPLTRPLGPTPILRGRVEARARSVSPGRSVCSDDGVRQVTDSVAREPDAHATRPIAS